MNKRIAVYAGSFDPVTLGHLDLVSRTYELFDELHLVVAKNISKNYLFSPLERKKLIEQSLVELNINSSKIITSVHSGLIVDYCKNVNAKILLRGLRAASDFEKEFQIATMNRHLDPEIETMHIMTDEKYFFVSSSLIKEVASLSGNLDHLVSKCVTKALKEKNL